MKKKKKKSWKSVREKIVNLHSIPTVWLKMLKIAGVVTKHRLEEGCDRASALQMAAQTIIDFLAVPGMNPPDRSLQAVMALAPSLGLAWCECGFPLIEVPPKKAAVLMASKLTKEAVEGLEPPWRCFAISYPGVSRKMEVSLVLNSHEMGFQVHTMGEDSFQMGSEPTLADYANAELSKKKTDQEGDLEYFDSAYRMTLLGGRLVCGVCGEMTGFERSVKEHPPTEPRLQREGRRVKEPSSWKFKITSPVKSDVRAAVRNYLGGGHGGQLALQHMVLGHYKWQAYGPGKSLRKFIHIEPYWRGPEDAPIAVRPHQMSKGGAS